MLKILIMFFIFFILNLNARENPFFPSFGEKDILYTSNQKNKKSKLKQVSIKLPSYARIIKKITIEYKNLDASVETQSIKLDNNIDWHLPIFISQQYTHKLNKNHLQKNIFQKITSIKYAKFYIYKNNFKIKTKDKILRNFLLVSPHRIVIDIAKNTSLKSFRKKIAKKGFKEIKIGNHNHFYRIVIVLDGIYTYNFKKTFDGYIFTIQ